MNKPKFKGFIDYQSPAKAGKKGKPLSGLSDEKKHDQTQPLEEKGSETALGSEPASGSDQMGDVDQIAESMGIYEKEVKSNKPGDESEDVVKEVNIAKEIEENKES